MRYVDPDGRADLYSFIDFSSSITGEIYDTSNFRRNKEQVSYYTQQYNTTDKQFNNVAKLSNIISNFGVPILTTVANISSKTFEGSGSNYIIASDFYDYIKSAESEIKRLDTLCEIFAETKPQFYAFIVDQKRLLQQEIDANKLEFYTNTAQAMYSWNQTSNNFNTKTLKEFMSLYPELYAYFESCVQEYGTNLQNGINYNEKYKIYCFNRGLDYDFEK